MLNLADSSSSEETFAYDAAGNLIGDHESNVYEYDSDNRLYSYNYCPVSYDADGNTTYAYLDSKTNHFEYDSANRLIKAGAYAYTYNAEDVRIRSTNGTNTTSYVYDTNVRLSRLLVKNTDGNATKYVYGLGLIGEIRTGPFKTYHFDYRGSTVAVTSECGTEMATFTYDTYGKLLSRTGRFKPIFLYNGRDGVVTDPNGLLYMRARYYSPVLRRFMNADLLAGDISDARTLNRYSYVCGDPVSFVDPFGLSADDWWKFAAGATIIVGLGVATFFTGGLAGVIVGGAFVGSLVGGTAGAVGGYIENGTDGALDGFFAGTITGAVSGAVAAYGANNIVLTLVDAGLDVGESLWIESRDGSITEVEVAEIVVDTVTGIALGIRGKNGVFYDNEVLSSAVDVQKRTLAKESRRANRNYAQKNIDRANKFYNDTRAQTLWKYGFATAKGEVYEFLREK